MAARARERKLGERTMDQGATTDVATRPPSQEGALIGGIDAKGKGGFGRGVAGGHQDDI
jgi:hypothetical protein